MTYYFIFHPPRLFLRVVKRDSHIKFHQCNSKVRKSQRKMSRCFKENGHFTCPNFYSKSRSLFQGFKGPPTQINARRGLIREVSRNLTSLQERWKMPPFIVDLGVIIIRCHFLECLIQPLLGPHTNHELSIWSEKGPVSMAREL